MLLFIELHLHHSRKIIDNMGFIKKVMQNPKWYTDLLFKVGKKAGVKVVYTVLVLYYALFDEEIPAKDRMMVMAALGYFILPVDLIPDGLPLGFTDDMAALVYVLKQIWNNLTPETIAKAKAKVREIFGDVDDRDFDIPRLERK
nr:unnamed protein product [uncultured bacterium]